VLSTTWGWIAGNSAAIQTVCIVLSAVAAFVVIWHNGKIGRRQATISMVMTTFFDGAHGESYGKFKDLILNLQESGTDISEFAEDRHDNEEGRAIILQAANHYEMVALGIKSGVFDEKFYKYWFFSQFTEDFDKLKPFIEKVRKLKTNQAYFCEFESMAVRWKRKKHPVKHPARYKMIWWTITNQATRLKSAVDASQKR
jgi:hypothetical protein